MAAAPRLTVRNLTSTPISIKRIEQFEDPTTIQSKAKPYFFKSKSTTSVLLTSTQLGSHVQSFNHQDLDIMLAPFESYTVKPPSGQEEAVKDDLVLSGKNLRLTIENNATQERYRIDSNPSYTQKSSQLLTPLSSTPSTSFSGLFHPSKPTPQLTIHPHHSENYYQKWMSEIPDSLPLSAISIPGTHNSHTHYRALPSVRCQVVDIKTQLENGIRFLDIRIQPAHATDVSKKDFYLVHGAFPASLKGTKYFEPILQVCYDFLEHNPSETIIMSLKREGVGGATDQHVAKMLEKWYFGTRREMWYTEPKIPYLKEVRGKIVLVRRFKVDDEAPPSKDPLPIPSVSTSSTSSPTQQYTQPAETLLQPKAPGLDATPWPDNTSSSLFPSPDPLFSLQDFYAVLTPSLIPEKLLHTTTHLASAAETQHPIPGITTDATNPVPPGPLVLNFLSASNFWRRQCWPENIANIINRGVEEWVCGRHGIDTGTDGGRSDGGSDVGARKGSIGADEEVGVVRKRGKGDAGTGVVVMDCVGELGDWSLVKLVICLNMGVLMRFQDAVGKEGSSG